MPAPTWQDRLDAAADEHEVIGITRDFIASFDPYEIEKLPVHCRPGKFFDANDVTQFAFTMVRNECGDPSEAAVPIHKLAAFFSAASIRLSRIMASDNRSDDSRQSA